MLVSVNLVFGLKVLSLSFTRVEPALRRFKYDERMFAFLLEDRLRGLYKLWNATMFRTLIRKTALNLQFLQL